MYSLNKRLYFFSDIDGTLLHQKIGRYEPNMHNMLTIQNFVGRGNCFVMATGRGLRDVQRIAKKLQIPVEYAITYNGAFVYKNNEEISSNTLTRDQIYLILTAASRSAIKYNEVLLYDETGDIYLRANTFLTHVQKLVRQILPLPITKIKPWKKATMHKLMKKNIRIPKLCFTSYNPYVIANLERKLRTLFANRLSIYCSSPYVLEICDAGVDKAHAIGLIMQRENIPLNHVAFVGDSGNDVQALKVLKHAYVMDHVKDVVEPADATITPSVAGAIAHFVDVYRMQ